VGILQKFNKPSAEQMENRTEYLQVENEMLTKEGEVAEKKAVIAQLKKQYGPDWKKIIGVQYLPSVSDLKGFLKTANQGMKGQSGKISNANISPLPPPGMRGGNNPSGNGSLSPLPNKNLRRL